MICMFPKERDAILKANPDLVGWTEQYVKATGFQGGGAVGWSRGRNIVVCPHACTLPGRGYSWPGSVSDRTVRGVYLHEIGHVVHNNFWGGSTAKMREVLNGLRELKGPRVTGYEPNVYETFAETWRLFAGNPALLEAGRPWRYEYLLMVGLKPPARMPRAWDRGLLGEPPQRYLDQCERWIERGKGRGRFTGTQLELI